MLASLYIAALIAASAGQLSAAPVTGVGDNLEALGVSAIANGERLMVVAGRRAPGKDFGPFVEVGLVVVPAAGGAGSFTKIPELDGSRADDVRYAFSSGGDLYFTKAAGTGAIRLGKVCNGRFVGVDIVLPPELASGDFSVQNIEILDDGDVDIGVRGSGNGTLVTLKPDLSVKTIRPIAKSAEFQAALRLRGGADRFVVVSSSGNPGLTGRAANELELRASDLGATPGRQQLNGLVSPPQQSADGTRIALSTRTTIPGLVAAHLFDAALAPVKSLVIVKKPSYPFPVGVLLSNTRLVALHAENGKCFAAVADSRDGRQLARREVFDAPGLRCMKVSGVITGARLMLVTTTMTATADGASASIATQVVPL
jgi:hypothetical protein